jgi:hypothetical protein
MFNKKVWEEDTKNLTKFYTPSQFKEVKDNVIKLMLKCELTDPIAKTVRQTRLTVSLLMEMKFPGHFNYND